jgi:peptidoglycan/LPS O-acetylase OafA/YrhL
MSSNQRIAVIDLLRGISCLGVLLYHVRVDLWVGWWRITNHPQEFSFFDKAMAWLSIPTPFLGYAILLFFLISGFCIHYPNTQPNYRPNWLTYFKRRFWRIYPTYFVAIIFTSSASFYCLLKWGDMDWSPDRIFRVLTLSQNYPPHYGQFLTNPSLWTIPLEIEFYALYPVAFFLLTRIKFFWLISLSVCISSVSVYLSKLGMQWISFTALFLWPSWLLGCWIAKLHRGNMIAKLNTLFLIAGAVLFLITSLSSFLEKWDSWCQYTYWTGFYFFLFLLFLRFEKVFSKFDQFFILKVISWLGKISYSLYLIHFPLFKLFGYIHRDFFGDKPANFLVTLIYLIPVIILSWLFYKFIENPIHKWSKKIKIFH